MDRVDDTLNGNQFFLFEIYFFQLRRVWFMPNRFPIEFIAGEGKDARKHSEDRTDHLGGSEDDDNDLDDDDNDDDSETKRRQ